MEGGHATKPNLIVRVPPNNAVNSGTKHPVVPPCFVEPAKLSNVGPRSSCRFSIDLSPVDAGVILKAFPDVASDDVGGPPLVVEAARIPGNPQFPHSKTTEKGPDGREFTESSRETLGEDTMMPVDGEVDRRICRAALNVVDERRTPCPDPVSLVANPKSVKNGLGVSRTIGAGGVNVVVGDLSP